MNQAELLPLGRRDGRAYARLLVLPILLLTLSALISTPARAEIGASEVQDYKEDVGVSTAVAEEHLETQERANEFGIVERLERRLDEEYAGVWFDNETGEFVVPVLEGDDRGSVASSLAKIGLDEHFRIDPVQSSWSELELAQEQLDRALVGLIEENLVQTSLDPIQNALVVHESSSAAGPDRTEIASSIEPLDVKVERRTEPAERFDLAPSACDESKRICDRPLRGGVKIEPSFEPEFWCSAAFKATSKTTGDRYLLTAGHCSKGTGLWRSRDSSNQPHDLGAAEGSVFPGGDWGRIKATGTYWDKSPWPTQVAYWGGNHSSAISWEGSSYVGLQACHSGARSGTSCGFVMRMGATVNYPEGTIFNATEVEGPGYCSMSGDSGGAVFAGDVALGIHSGDRNGGEGLCGNPGIYIEITEATDALGVSVAPRVGVPPIIPGEDDNVPGPHVVAQTNGTTDAFYRTPSGGLGHTWKGSGSDKWSSENLPGSLHSLSVPHPIVQPNGTIDVFYRTPSGGLGHNWFDTGGLGWLQGNLPGSLASEPHPVVQLDGTIDVFWRTPSGALGHAWKGAGGSWAEGDLSGSLASDPYPVVQPNGTIDVFWRTPSGALGHAWKGAGGSWAQSNLPGSIHSSSRPRAVAQPNGTIDVFWRTPSNGLGHAWYAPCCGGWSSNVLAGTLASDPHPVLQPNGTMDVFWRTPSNGLGHAWHGAGGGWAQADLPASLASDPYPVVQANGTIDVFWRTPSNFPGHAWYTPGGSWAVGELSGLMDSASAPHAVAQPGGLVEVFMRSPSGQLGHGRFAPCCGGWSSAILPGSLGF